MVTLVPGNSDTMALVESTHQDVYLFNNIIC